MSVGERQSGGLRAFAERIAGGVAGNPGVVRLRAVMASYDRAGGGLMAAGLAYTSLLAVLPGLLLGLSIVGWVVRSPADREQILAIIAQGVPPLRDLAGIAFEQVSANAVPSGLFAILTLLWGSSRFYANLDTALARVFLGAGRRNIVDQTIRGIALTLVLVVLPVTLVAVGSVVTWAAQFAPSWLTLSGILQIVLELASPVGSLFAFVLAVALCYRYVPDEHVKWRAVRVPAVGAGVVLAVLTQLYAFIFPRLVGVAAVYGTFVAAFALLAWLSVAFNVLLLGAAWTDVRVREGIDLEGEARVIEHDVEGAVEHLREDEGSRRSAGR